MALIWPGGPQRHATTGTNTPPSTRGGDEPEAAQDASAPGARVLVAEEPEEGGEQASMQPSW